MREMLVQNHFLWIFLTVFFYVLGARLKKKWDNPLFTPLIFSIICTMAILLIFRIDYEDYMLGGQYVSLWVTPATVALAIKLEKNFKYLKENYIAILSGIVGGVLFHTILILAFALIFRHDATLFATLFPKSVTTAIALGVSESLGGYVSLTVAIVVFTGVYGSVIAPGLLRGTGINDPVAQGIAIGASSHAMGTTKAIEMGEIQGAMSGLSMVVTGIVVVLFNPLAEFIMRTFF